MTNQAEFALGQRWLSNTETELGLGTLVGLEGRRITLLFPSTGETRVYASQSAPLTRIQFKAGEIASSHEGWKMRVIELAENKGHITYTGERLDTGEVTQLNETMLDHNYQLNQPERRLLTGQFDSPKWFELRQQCLSHQYQHATSPLLGFVGARVDLIPHQLHIAAEVGRRHAPRVLLADEVGLGKTIEAALIIHQQLLTNRAKRVLIVVPSSLVHQWLVEMLRRVNLPFSIFDEERCQAMAGEQGNPFESEQLVLCSLDFLTHNSRYYEQALGAEWDLLVVDEAHHLTWSDGQPSQQYQVIEALAQVTKGVLLLTATPDQLGHESHFARLRLLDPARFHDYQAFINEEQQYSSLATAIKPLLGGEAISDDAKQAIAAFAGDELLKDCDLSDEQARHSLLNDLLDRHGTGRLLFRNSRAGISGFPKRQLFSYALDIPSQYAQILESSDDLIIHISPERHQAIGDSWVNFDPRVSWFVDKLQELKGEKVLTICADANTALQLADAVRVKSGIPATVFHEGMSIVERDRAANFFAQSEDGAQVLICSEIGSEGRNFQFAHHLVLFDLPLVPDLLEQRIGRLDRIGQTEDVCLHVPYFSGCASEVMMNWYDKGLEAFSHTCPTGTAVYEEVVEQLQTCLFSPDDSEQVDALLSLTNKLHLELKARLEQGRDQLLELNSSGKGRIESLLSDIMQSDQSPTLETFMTRLFDALGVVQEEKDDSCYLLRPGESMLSQLPGLDEDGMTITYERETATQMENVHFFSWDHPMIHHAMDMLTTDVVGKSALAIAKDHSLPAGVWWLECLFVLSAQAPEELQLQRFLPPTPIRVCVDAKGGFREEAFPQLHKINKQTANQLVNALKTQIEAAIKQGREQAEKNAAKIVSSQTKQMQQQLGGELARLTHLKAVNPAIRDEELAHLEAQIIVLTEIMAEANVSLEAVRLVINNP